MDRSKSQSRIVVHGVGLRSSSVRKRTALQMEGGEHPPLVHLELPTGVPGALQVAAPNGVEVL